jgi:hypothetical protein
MLGDSQRNFEPFVDCGHPLTSGNTRSSYGCMLRLKVVYNNNGAGWIKLVVDKQRRQESLINSEEYHRNGGGTYGHYRVPQNGPAALPDSRI